MKFCRFTTREDEDNSHNVVLGINKGLLKKGFVYQIEEVLGELIIKEVGPSVVKKSALEPNHCCGITWGNDANFIIESGNHLYSENEYNLICNTESLKRAEEKEDFEEIKKIIQGMDLEVVKKHFSKYIRFVNSPEFSQIQLIEKFSEDE